MGNENLRDALRRGKIVPLPETTNAPFGASFGMDYVPVVNVCFAHTFVVNLTTPIVLGCLNGVKKDASSCAVFGYTLSDQS